MMPVYSVTQILMRFAQFMMMSPVMVLGKTAALYSFRGAACKGMVTVCPTMPERCQPLATTFTSQEWTTCTFPTR
ncbi:hypothetical protein GBAR_LOCUS24704, partial [Geodia barretti]